MSKRQLQIAGTERTEVPEIEQAAEAYCEIRDERSDMSKREAQKKLELLAIMRANNLKIYRYHDGSGEEREVVIDDEPKVKVRKTGEAESDIGEGVEGFDSVAVNDGPSQGLIDQALRAQDDANVQEDADGDVTVPDKAAPKSKPKSRKKAK